MIGAVIALSLSQLDHDVDPARFLDAITKVEGHKWSDPGGRYGFTRATWKGLTILDYRWASTKLYADQVANDHLSRLAAQLRANDYPVTAYTLAACWNLGFAGYRRRVAVLDYAVRVVNIYEAGSK